MHRHRFLVAALLAASVSSAQAMQLSSTDFADGARLALAQVNSRCGGRNVSPALSWTGAPAGTKSFALTVFDPDAGGGRGFWHWILFDIPATVSSLAEGAGSGAKAPAGAVQADNGFGEAGYGGACPPAASGLHHYQFTLYALGSATVPLGGNAGAGELAAYFKAHALATAALTGTYQR